jgi:hypothetical protein
MVKASIVGVGIAPARRSRGRARKEGASFPMPPSISGMPADYVAVLAGLKQRIAAAQARAALAVSRELAICEVKSWPRGKKNPAVCIHRT